MGMTMSQRILIVHAGPEEVKAGQPIEVGLDLMLGNDITSPAAVNEMKKMGRKAVFDKDKTALVMDHFIPNKNVKSAESYKCCREFACHHEVTNYLDVGDMGIEHALLPERGLVVAGDVVTGASSHIRTCGALGVFSIGVGSTDMAAGMVTGRAWLEASSAIRPQLAGKPVRQVSGKDVVLHAIGMVGVDRILYRPIEFVGEGVRSLSMGDRFTICNMIIEVGGKNGILPVDELTMEYMKEHSKREFIVYEADKDTEYNETHVINLSELKPTVSFPHPSSNVRTIDRVGEVKVGQAVIDSCTNGRAEDMRIAVEVLGDREIVKGVCCIVIPATQPICLQVMKEGFLEIFIKAGAVMSTPTYGPRPNGYMGILAAGERYIPTTNRNFVRHMGHVDSEVYLASPAVAVASAVVGKIICPYQLDQRNKGNIIVKGKRD